MQKPGGRAAATGAPLRHPNPVCPTIRCGKLSRASLLVLLALLPHPLSSLLFEFSGYSLALSSSLPIVRREKQYSKEAAHRGQKVSGRKSCYEALLPRNSTNSDRGDIAPATDSCPLDDLQHQANIAFSKRAPDVVCSQTAELSTPNYISSHHSQLESFCHLHLFRALTHSLLSFMFWVIGSV